MEEKEIKKLAEKISNGTASQKEVALYNYYYNKFQDEANWNSEELQEPDYISKEIYSRITDKLPEYSQQPKSFPYLKIAAAIALFTISFGLYLVVKTGEKHSVDTQETRFALDAEPGSNTAILTLSDGSKLKLDSLSNGILAKQGYVNIEKTSDGAIVYNLDNESEKNHSYKLRYNTITIPRGGKYNLTLPDGTRVWLNSSSSIKFPALFATDKRVVELEGEAYFEVAKQKNALGKLPFIVKTPLQEIKVLGTHFNVNAYNDENITKTTLLEGSVEVRRYHSINVLKLKPGQQSQTSASGGLVMAENIDPEEITAWKNDLFYFNNTDIKTVMMQLSRWYNVDVDFKNMPQRSFSGVLSRNVKLSQVLLVMEKTSNLKFKIDEGGVSVK